MAPTRSRAQVDARRPKPGAGYIEPSAEETKRDE